MGGASDADRQRARKIRRTPVAKRTPKERAWLRGYEENHGGRGNGQKPRRGTRVVIESDADDGEQPQTDAKVVKAEGDRLDRVLTAFEGLMEQARTIVKDAHAVQRDVIALLMSGKRASDRTHVESLIALKDALIAGAAAEGTLAAIKAAEAMDEEKAEGGLDRDFKAVIMRELGIGGGGEKSNPGPNGAGGNNGGHG